MEGKVSIRELLTREMEARNWSQREMAKVCQLSNTTISKIVRDQSVPDPSTCFKLAQGLELPAPYVLRMAGHEIADAQMSPPSLEALLHAQFDHLADRAIQEMIGAIRAIESVYTTPSSADLQVAQQKLEKLEFIRRWLDPVKQRVLTVVQGGNFLFYQTADLDSDGQEANRSELLPIEAERPPRAGTFRRTGEDISRLSTFPALKFANSFCVQLYPLCEFQAHRCHSHPLHAVLFTPIYAGDRGSGVLVVYPDGRQVDLRDQTTERVWQRLYADFAPPVRQKVPCPIGAGYLRPALGVQAQAARGGRSAENGAPPLPPSIQRFASLRQKDKVRTRWIEGNPDELWVNPDTRTYAAFFASSDGDTPYSLLTGPLAEMDAPDWRTQSAERIEIVDAALYGRFETSIVHLQGFCLKLYPEIEHITATRHIVPAHRTLLWSENSVEHICVVQEYLETWLHLCVDRDERGRVSVTVVEDVPLRAETGRRKSEQTIQELKARHIPFLDSRSPHKVRRNVIVEDHRRRSSPLWRLKDRTGDLFVADGPMAR